MLLLSISIVAVTYKTNSPIESQSCQLTHFITFDLVCFSAQSERIGILQFSRNTLFPSPLVSKLVEGGGTSEEKQQEGQP